MNQAEDRVNNPPEVLAEIQHLMETVVGTKTNQGLILAYLAALFTRGEDAAKEHSIAIDALGRDAGFDPKKEAIVRVEIHKLRRTLKAYYTGPGRGREVHIGLGPGKYALTVEKFKLEAPPQKPEPLTSVVLAPPPQQTGPGRRQLLWLAGAALVAIALVFGYQKYAAVSGAPKTSDAVALAAIPTAGVRILAGTPGRRYVDSAGQEWTGDNYFTGGHAVMNTSVRIQNTPDQTLYKGQREGDFSYDIPLPPGDYEVRAHFAETHYGKDNLGGGGESSRRFQIFLNGAPVSPALDVILDAGGPNLALVKVFPGLRPDTGGKLHIRFESLGNDKSFVNALEIVPGLKDRMLPLRIAVGAPQVAVDSKGRLWLPDRYVVSGRTVERVKPVASDSPEVFRFERFGRFEYVLPAVPGHQFQLKLWMAEQYFGVYTPAGSRPPRVFDIFSNGVALARDFSILDTAGGPAKGVERTFPHLTPDAQGNIRVLFTPSANYVALNGIELTDEGPAGRFR